MNNYDVIQSNDENDVDMEYVEDYAPADAYIISINNEILNAAETNKHNEEIKEPLANVKSCSEALYDEMNNFSDAEKVYGTVPSVWTDFSPRSKEIKQNIQNMGNQFMNDSSEAEKQEAVDKTIDSINSSADYFRQQYERLLSQEQIHLQEMAEIRKQLEEMNMIFKREMEYRKTLSLGMSFMTTVDDIRKKAHELKDYAYGNIYKKVRQTVHYVHDRLVHAPAEYKEAIKEPLSSMRDLAVSAVKRKITDVLEHGILFLNKIKYNVNSKEVQEAERDSLSDTLFNKLKNKDKLATNEVVYMINHYQNVKNNFEKNFMDKFNDNALSTHCNVMAMKETVNQMVKDGLNNNRIALIAPKLETGHSLVPDEVTEKFDLGKYLNSAAIKSIRQNGMTLTETRNNKQENVR